MLMVAGMRSIRGGGYGGQMAVASSLLASEFGRYFTIVPLSTTPKKLPGPPPMLRLAIVARRVAQFSMLLPQVDAVLVFGAGALSLMEKGVMCMLARAAGKGVVLRLSSGDLPELCDRHPMLKRFLRATLASAHVVISQGPFWTGYFAQFPEATGKILEIVNGIPLPPPGVTAGRGLGRGARIGFVGSMDRAKGIYDAIAMLQRLRHRFPDVELVMAGGGGELSELRRQVRAAGLQGAVWTPGWVDRADIYPLLRSLDVFILPSYFEGLPNAVLEAMAAERPVVATRVGSLADVVVQGETGYLFDVGDVDALVDRVGRLLADPERAAAMGRAGAQRVRARFDVERAWPLFVTAVEQALRAAQRTSG